MEMENLVDKRILIIKNDGFKKFGILRGYDTVFLKLEFLDGNIEFIPLASIASVGVDRR